LKAFKHPSMEGRLAPSLERRRLRAYVAMLLVDWAVFLFSFALAALVWEGHWAEPRAMLAAQAMLPVYFTIALYNGTYAGKALGNWVYAARKSLIALTIAAALVNIMAFYAKSNEEFSRATLTVGLLFGAVGLVAVRRGMAVVIARLWGGRVFNRLVIDDGGPAFPFAGSDHIAAGDYALDPTSHDPFMLDRLGKLLRNQDQVVVSCPPDRHSDWAFLLKSTGVSGEIVSKQMHELGVMGVQRYDDLGRTTVVVSSGPLGFRARITKRIFDLAVAGVALLVLSPLLILVAVLIRLEDGGPVLFVQRRLGRGNQFFDMIKFRSMRQEKLDHAGDRSASRQDDRVTRIGAFIRRTSIDELPQLINVLKGEMAIVGPRPHALGSRANNKLFWEVDRSYWQRHCLKPGLTGLAQVRGHRGATEAEKDLTDRLQSDLEYIARWSLRRDIGIVLRTAGVLIHDKAY
jgi:lipopolysaccharide/colanic/teichoic acid biosynthesis glycosyltransferase